MLPRDDQLAKDAGLRLAAARILCAISPLAKAASAAALSKRLTFYSHGNYQINRVATRPCSKEIAYRPAAAVGGACVYAHQPGTQILLSRKRLGSAKRVRISLAIDGSQRSPHERRICSETSSLPHCAAGCTQRRLNASNRRELNSPLISPAIGVKSQEYGSRSQYGLRWFVYRS
jgi:hypothetical protein